MKKTIEIKTITTFTFAHLKISYINAFYSFTSRTLSTFYAAKAQSFIRIKAMTFDAPSQQ
jgi:hypothetical protein